MFHISRRDHGFHDHLQNHVIPTVRPHEDDYIETQRERRRTPQSGRITAFIKVLQVAYCVSVGATFTEVISMGQCHQLFSDSFSYLHLHIQLISDTNQLRPQAFLPRRRESRLLKIQAGMETRQSSRWAIDYTADTCTRGANQIELDLRRRFTLWFPLRMLLFHSAGHVVFTIEKSCLEHNHATSWSAGRCYSVTFRRVRTDTHILTQTDTLTYLAIQRASLLFSSTTIHPHKQIPFPLCKLSTPVTP